MSEPLQRTHIVEESGLRVVLHAHPAVNLALVHNGVPLITALEVENTSDSDLIDVTVTVHLHGAGGELAPAWSRTHDGRLEPGRAQAWHDLSSVVPATDQLQGLNESYRATITVTVSSLWRDTVQLTVPIKVLAHNEWFNAPIFYDSLAAFVQPNTRAVSTVLDAASRILQESTGDSSLGGYQGGPERAAMIAAAVYEALHGANIRYIDPPASFEGTGQKIRTTAQVLDQRFGTCIDLAVTYAACLEAAGIRPLVWLADGHAFAGFLRDEYTQTSPSLTEQNELVNLVESGMAVPVEAIYYQPGPDGSFKSAVANGRRHFADPDRIRGVIGIAAARKDGVLPLPEYRRTRRAAARSRADSRPVAPRTTRGPAVAAVGRRRRSRHPRHGTGACPQVEAVATRPQHAKSATESQAIDSGHRPGTCPARGSPCSTTSRTPETDHAWSPTTNSARSTSSRARARRARSIPSCCSPTCATTTRPTRRSPARPTRNASRSCPAPPERCSRRRARRICT